MVTVTACDERRRPARTRAVLALPWSGLLGGRSVALSKVAGLVLAAGGGRRYGGPKALVSRQGQLLVERAVATLRDGGCAPILVVVGAEADRVRAEATLGEV